MPTIATDAGHATFINSFRCRPKIVEEVAAGSPGFVSAGVHRSTDGTLVNHLQWRTAEDLARMHVRNAP